MDDTENDFEIRSPLFSNIKDDARDVLDQANACATSINPILFPVENVAATNRVDLARDAFDFILSQDKTIGVHTGLLNFHNLILSAASYCEGIAGQPITQLQGANTRALSDELVAKAEWIDKRCYCSAGVCKAELVPDKNKFGDYGMSYNITEGVDGSSLSKQVLISILPVNDLPVAVDTHSQGLESITQSYREIDVTIPLARDEESDQSFSLTYEIVSPPSKGTFRNCALANDGSLPTDRTCKYRPLDKNEGVASPLVNKTANATILGSNGVDGIRFTAKTGGPFGELISINILQHPLLRSNANVLVETNQREIFIYIEHNVTTVADVVNAVQSDKYASSIVKAESTNPLTHFANKQQVTPVAIPLIGANLPFDTFTYRVSDGQGYSATVGYGSIDIELQDDLPVPTPISILDLQFSEDTEKIITMNFTDAEGDTGVSCSVQPTNSVFTGAASTSALINTTALNCSCSVGTQTCSATLKPRPDFVGAAYFKWNITDSMGKTTTTQNAIAIVSNVNDVPYARYHSTTHAESPVSTAGAPFEFNFSQGIDIEGSGLTYQYIGDGAIDGGTLSGCVDGSNNINISTTCQFTPKDGNITGVSTTLASGVFSPGAGSLTFTAKTNGETGNSIKVHVLNHPSAVNYVPAVNILNNKIIEVRVEPTDTLDEVQSAIESHPYATEMISVTPAGDGSTVVGGGQLVSLAGAEPSAHKFNYSVTDSSGASATGTYHINITPTDDIPVICPYSTFPNVKECGLGGCIDMDSPINKSITPSKEGIVFYDQRSAVCYRSVADNSTFKWEIRSSYNDVIPAQSVHQNGSFKINNIKVDEGGADASEDANFIRIEDIIISDGGLDLIPKKPANLKLFYNNSQVVLNQATTGISPITSGNIDSGGTSADTSDFSFEVIPASFKLGQAVITVVFAEYDPTNTKVNSVSVSFDVNIEDIAIQHNGWESIVASGPKVDNFGAVQDSDYVCNHSQTKCNSGDSCYGNTSELSSASADQEGAIFYNTQNSKCYYASAQGIGNWREFDSYCGATPSFYDSSCSNSEASCLSENPPSANAQKLNTLFTQAVYDSFNNKVSTTCFRSSGRDSLNGWEEFKGFGEVLLKWEPMLLTGSGSIVGYNVFRRLSNEEYDYTNPINKGLVSAATTQYVDNSTQSFFGPVPNTVYFYEVVPVVTPTSSSAQFQIRTSDYNSSAIVRVLVPGENKSLVPRDIVNITMCKKIGDSAGTGDIYVYDSTLKTYTCAYEGPGDNGNSQYDIGKDLVVDRFEAGCAYTKSTDPVASCSSGVGNIALDGSCIGVVDPTVDTVSVGSSSGQIYYNRSSGKCYQLTAGTSTWTEVDGLGAFSSVVNNYASAYLPPLTNITQAKANSFCAATSTKPVLGLCDFNTSGVGAPAGGVNGDVYYKTDEKICYVNVVGTWIERHSTISGRLPSRKEQIAYSEWDYSQVSHSTVNTREGGLSLNSNSKCNTTSANGLENFYTDDVSPVVNSIFTIAGTDSSGIRSVMTGSNHTKACSSKYGLQDTIGNVTEWTHDRMACGVTGLSSFCQSIINGDGQYIGTAEDDLNLSSGAVGFYSQYMLNGFIGPCIDADSDGNCDDYLQEWIFDQKSNGASRFSIPMGLPLTTEFITANPGQFINSFFEQIGISSGITATQLHDDSIIVNQELIDGTGNPSNDSGGGTGFAGFVTGGSYTKGNGSGTYHLEMVPMLDPALNRRSDIGFRCVSPVPSSSFIE